MALLEWELLYCEIFKNVCDFSCQILKRTKNNVLPQFFPKDSVQVDRIHTNFSFYFLYFCILSVYNLDVYCGVV